MSLSSPFLRRKAAAEYLRDHGIPIASTTLAKLACIGGGPKFHSYNRIPLYRCSDLDVWIGEHLTPPRRSTADNPAEGGANAR